MGFSKIFAHLKKRMIPKVFIILIAFSLSSKCHAAGLGFTNSITVFKGSSGRPLSAARDALFIQAGISDYFKKLEKIGLETITNAVGKEPLYAVVFTAKTIRDKKICLNNLKNPMFQDVRHDFTAGLKEFQINARIEF